MEDKRYRLVSDYGYGDKTWLYRDLTEAQAIQAYMSACRWEDRENPPDLDHCLDSDHTWYLEEDHPDDQEDWDWQDS